MNLPSKLEAKLKDFIPMFHCNFIEIPYFLWYKINEYFCNENVLIKANICEECLLTSYIKSYLKCQKFQFHKIFQNKNFLPLGN